MQVKDILHTRRMTISKQVCLLF